MLRHLFAVLAVVLVAGTGRAGALDPIAAPAGSYRLDAARSSLTARASIMGGLYRYPLRFRSMSGSLDQDPDDLPGARVAMMVDPRAVEARDKAAVRVALALFEPDLYPTIAFRSRAYRPIAEGRGELLGDLTLHGVTRPLLLHVALQDVAADRLRFSGRGKVRRSEHGMTSGRVVTGDVIDLSFDVEFVRK